MNRYFYPSLVNNTTLSNENVDNRFYQNMNSISEKIFYHIVLLYYFVKCRKIFKASALPECVLMCLFSLYVSLLA